MSNEWLDVITPEDIVTHQAERAQVHAQGLWHRGVHVFLFTAEGKMLIQLRSADRKQYPSLWDGSLSEHVQAGETYLAAAQRGLWEELGLRDVTLTPHLRFRFHYGPGDNEISALFTGAVEAARVRFDPGEIARVEFREADELLPAMQRGEMALCPWFVELLRWQRGEACALSLLGMDFC